MAKGALQKRRDGVYLAEGSTTYGRPGDTETALIDPPSHFGTAQLADLKPERVGSILREGASGRFETWADLQDKMLETDEHLASVWETRVTGITSRDWVIEPPETGPETRQLAEEGAQFLRESLEALDDFDRVYADVLDADWRGVSVLEHDWQRQGRRILSKPFWVHPRNVQFGRDWQVQVRANDRRWIDLPPDKFVVHSPHMQAGVPTMDGLARSVAWVWIFKFWAMNFWVIGAERAANPMMVAEVPPHSEDRVREEALDALEQLSADQGAVIEKETGIRALDIKFTDSADVWEKLVARCDAAMSKRVVGSTLNVEVTATGGNRAAAESQAEQTVMPRLMSSDKRASGTVMRDWFRPALRFNAHLFNGRTPPTPRIRRVFDSGEREIPAHIWDALVGSGNAVTVNEALELAGLEPKPPEIGEQYLKPAAKTPPTQGPLPQREPITSPETEEAGPDPLAGRRSARRARQLTLPLTARTSSGSRPRAASPLRKALSPESDDPQS